MPTIKQVADHAGVSVATVSRVINKTGYVSPDLQQRVTSAMQELNYQPSALARSLRRQETQTVGVLVPQIDHPFFSALTFSIEKTLFANQYRTFICSAEEDAEKEDAYVQMLLRQRVDGVIITPTGYSADNIRRLLDQGVPVVLVDRDLPALSLSRVLCDNRRGSYQGARYLLDVGHRHIATIGAPAYSEPMIHRLAGIRQAFAEYGINYDAEPFVTGTLQQFDMGYTSARDLLRRTPRPSAIFALTDVMAVGVLHAAADFGLQVPRDLSIIGFDDIPLASHIIPKLTTIAQPIYAMGEMSAQLLLRHMQDPDALMENVILESRLVLRDTTAPPLDEARS